MKEKIKFLLDEFYKCHPNDPRTTYFLDMVRCLFKTNYKETLIYIESINQLKYFEAISSSFESLSLCFQKQNFISLIKKKAEEFNYSKFHSHILEDIREAEEAMKVDKIDMEDYYYTFDIKKIVFHLSYVIKNEKRTESQKKKYPALLIDMLTLNSHTTIYYLKSITEVWIFLFLSRYFELISSHFKNEDIINVLKRKSEELGLYNNKEVIMNLRKAEEILI